MESVIEARTRSDGCAEGGLPDWGTRRVESAGSVTVLAALAEGLERGHRQAERHPPRILTAAGSG